MSEAREEGERLLGVAGGVLCQDFAAGFVEGAKWRASRLVTDAEVHAAYRGFRESHRGRPADDGEYEATFSRVEFAWLRAALEAARESDDEPR